MEDDWHRKYGVGKLALDFFYRASMNLPVWVETCMAHLIKMCNFFFYLKLNLKITDIIHIFGTVFLACHHFRKVSHIVLSPLFQAFQNMILLYRFLFFHGIMNEIDKKPNVDQFYLTKFDGTISNKHCVSQWGLSLQQKST